MSTYQGQLLPGPALYHKPLLEACLFRAWMALSSGIPPMFFCAIIQQTWPGELHGESTERRILYICITSC